jgi:TolB protein
MILPLFRRNVTVERRFLNILRIVALGILLACTASTPSRVIGQTAPLPSKVSGLLHPQVSPDGKLIALSWHGSIGIVPVDGGVLDIIDSSDGYSIEPTWSPDRRRLAFLLTDDGIRGRLTIVDADSGRQIALPFEVEGTANLAYDREGKRILGQFGNPGAPLRPAWLDLETGRLHAVAVPTELLRPLKGMRLRMALAGDSRTIYFAIHPDETGEQAGNSGEWADVYAVDAESGDARALFRWPGSIDFLAPGPGDGGLVIESNRVSALNRIWLVPDVFDPESARLVPESTAAFGHPGVNPRGGALVWAGLTNSGTTELRSFDPASGRSRPVAITRFTYPFPAGQLEVTAVDARAGATTAARVSVRGENGKYYFPNDGRPHHIMMTTTQVSEPAGFFVTSGRSVLTLPEGRYRVRVARGHRYRSVERSVDVTRDSATKVRLRLAEVGARLFRDWYSGETHIHANYSHGYWHVSPELALTNCEAEDLNVCGLLAANSYGSSIFDHERTGQLLASLSGQTIAATGIEFRSTFWGHLAITNVAGHALPFMSGFPSSPEPGDHPSTGEIIEIAKMIGATVSHTHIAANDPLDLYGGPYSAKGLPVDAVVHGARLIDVHGLYYSGSIHLWYKLLNAGIPMIATSGTDAFLNGLSRVPPGWARTYVRIPQGFSRDRWLQGESAGNSFISNGPLVDLVVDGRRPGDTIRSEGARTLAVQVRVRSDVPLDNVAIIFNGTVMQAIPIRPDKKTVDYEGSISVETSGWLALTASGPSNPQTVRAPSSHTNPIWIEVPGTGNPHRRDSAVYFIAWLDRVRQELERRDRFGEAEFKRKALDDIQRSREFFVRSMGSESDAKLQGAISCSCDVSGEELDECDKQPSGC